MRGIRGRGSGSGLYMQSVASLSAAMPRSGGASKASETLSQPSSERVAVPDDRRDSEEDDSDTEIMEISDNGRYQKMIDQVSEGLDCTMRTSVSLQSVVLHFDCLPYSN